jgi:Ca2+/H+ antiporter
VEIVQEVLERVGISQEFLGVTLICLTPAATEIANAGIVNIAFSFSYYYFSTSTILLLLLLLRVI